MREHRREGSRGLRGRAAFQAAEGREVERDLRGVLVTAWPGPAITDITELDVLKIINAKKTAAPGCPSATHIKQLSRFAVGAKVYGITVSPCADLIAKDIWSRAGGPPRPRRRGSSPRSQGRPGASWRPGFGTTALEGGEAAPVGRPSPRRCRSGRSSGRGRGPRAAGKAGVWPGPSAPADGKVFMSESIDSEKFVMECEVRRRGQPSGAFAQGSSLTGRRGPVRRYRGCG